MFGFEVHREAGACDLLDMFNIISSQKKLMVPQGGISFNRKGGSSLKLGGGNSNFWNFHPENWENEPILTSIFFQRGWFNNQLERVFFAFLPAPEESQIFLLNWGLRNGGMAPAM